MADDANREPCCTVLSPLVYTAYATMAYHTAHDLNLMLDR
jgi:hypothetical protein